MNFSVQHRRVFDIAVQSEMAFIVPDLTFPYFYFEILFCQNKVKKNRKSVLRVFFKNTDIRRGKRHRKYEYGVR